MSTSVCCTLGLVYMGPETAKCIGLSCCHAKLFDVLVLGIARIEEKRLLGVRFAVSVAEADRAEAGDNVASGSYSYRRSVIALTVLMRSGICLISSKTAQQHVRNVCAAHRAL